MTCEGLARLGGRRILVTGAARGIGRTVAAEFVHEGAAVGLLDVEETAVSAVEDELTGLGAKVAHRVVDISMQAEAARAVRELGEALGGVDGVVAVAGITRPERAAAMSPESWQRVIDVNLGGTFYVIQAALPWMERVGGGSVVAIGSIAAYGGPVGRASYSASKAGLIGLIRNLAIEFGPSAIRFNVVAPGHIRSAMGERDPAGMELSASKTPLRRVGEPSDVARACLFLISDESSYITGQVLNVCGGRTLWQSDAPVPPEPRATT